MSTTLYFVRHGETDYNRHRIVQGRRINSTLNPTGESQARALAERLRDVPFDAIYASTQHRAIQTAQAVADAHPGVPVIHLLDLEEMSWGALEGVPVSEATKQTFTSIYAEWESGNFDARVPEGESVLEVQARALRAYRRILEAQRGGTVLVVAHGRLLRVLLASILPEFGLERMHDIHHANTSVNRVLVDDDGCVCADLLNCTAHLDAVTSTLVE